MKLIDLMTFLDDRIAFYGPGRGFADEAVQNSYREVRSFVRWKAAQSSAKSSADPVCVTCGYSKAHHERYWGGVDCEAYTPAAEGTGQ